MGFAKSRAENKIFRELNQQLKVAYNVQSSKYDPDTNKNVKVYKTDALDISFNLETSVLEVYDIYGSQICEIDCEIDGDWVYVYSMRLNNKFYRLYNYAKRRAREPKKPVESEKYNKIFQDGQASQLQKLKMAVHSMKYAYHEAWYKGQARTY